MKRSRGEDGQAGMGAKRPIVRACVFCGVFFFFLNEY
jgi:hypothetical protein